MYTYLVSKVENYGVGDGEETQWGPYLSEVRSVKDIQALEPVDIVGPDWDISAVDGDEAYLAFDVTVADPGNTGDEAAYCRFGYVVTYA